LEGINKKEYVLKYSKETADFTLKPFVFSMKQFQNLV